jgi:hypothetical protein
MGFLRTIASQSSRRSVVLCASGSLQAQGRAGIVTHKRCGVQKLSELVTLRVRQRTTLTGQNNWYKGIWEIEGDALFGCDCGQAKWSAIDQEHKTLTLRLPEPRLQMARVDHERTRLYDFRCITWNPACLFQGDPDAIKEEAMKHAQEKLGNTANTEEHLSVAKQQAEYKLRDFYTVLGWNLTVGWQ